MTPRIDPAGARGPARVQRFAHDAMACTFELFVVAADRGYAGQAARAAFDEVDRLEGELSRFRPGGDVARIALLSRGESLRVSHEVLECLQLAARVQMETGGAFDVTFRAAPGPGEPREEGPAGRLEIDPRNLTVTARRDHVPVDLGGIGKGAALDRIGEILGEWGLEAALLHAGRSTVLARGAPPAGTGWSVALRRPRWGGEGGEAGDALPGVVTLRDRALAGSGRDLHGEHILDPRTGAPPPPPPRGTLAAWAAAPTAALADALSTAFLVLHPDEIGAYCAAHPSVSACVLRQGAAAPEPRPQTFSTDFAPLTPPPEPSDQRRNSIRENGSPLR